MFKWKSIIDGYINRLHSVVCKTRDMKVCNSLDISKDEFRSQIADVTYNYKEFRES